MAFIGSVVGSLHLELLGGVGGIGKTLILGLGANVADVYTDVETGLFYMAPKNVTRFFGPTDILPGNCLANGTNKEYYLCEETDPIWAAIAFSCIQLPAVVLALCAALGAFFIRLTEDEQEYRGYWKILLAALLLLIIPFPVVVFAQQIASLFVRSDQMTFLSAVFLFGEGSLEAAPQLLLLLYAILSGRQPKVLQWVSIVSSIFAISKTSIELFLGESYDGRTTPEAVRKHTDSLNDSITKGKNLKETLRLWFKFSPAFLTSLIFKVGSIAIICILLKKYVVIYLVLGILTNFIVAFKTYDTGINIDEKIGFSTFYALANVTILAKCPLENRQINFRAMMNVSMTWLILHSTSLVGLMLWVGALPTSTHFAHWSDQTLFLIEPTLFYPAICALIFLLGPFSIFCLRCLQTQVLSFEKVEKEKKEAEEKVEKEKKEAEEKLEKVEEEKKEKENEENEKCCLCLPLCSSNPGVEYEDGVRLFWNATRKSNCKVKRDGDDEEKGGQASDGKVGKKVEYKVEEKNGQEEGVSLLPIDSA